MCRTQEEPGFLNEKWMFEDALPKYNYVHLLKISCSYIKYISTTLMLNIDTIYLICKSDLLQIDFP